MHDFVVGNCLESASKIIVNLIKCNIKPILSGRKKRSSDPVPSTSFDIKVSGKMNIPGMFLWQNDHNVMVNPTVTYSLSHKRWNAKEGGSGRPSILQKEKCCRGVHALSMSDKSKKISF